jgi:hypothetical protein
LSGGNIIFSSAPNTGEDFFGVILAGADYVNAGANFPDGTLAAPSITFDQDNDTGYYRSGSGAVSFAANGVAAGTWSSAGLTAPALIPTGSTVPSNGVYLPSTNNVAISTNGSGRLFVDSSGRTLIGTSSSTGDYLFEVQGRVGTSAGGSEIRLSRGETATQIGGNGSMLGRIWFTSGSDNGQGAQISAHADATWSSNDYPTRLVFATTADAASSPTERMRIDSSGRVGIGTTSASSLLTLRSTAADNTAGISMQGASAGNITNLYNTLTDFVVQHAASEAFRVDSSRRLLIGTSTSLSSTSLIQAYKSSGTLGCLLDSDSLSNGELVRFQAIGGAREVTIGVSKHSGITNPCAYIELQCEDAAYNYLWADNSDILRISTNSAHIGTTSGTVVGAQTSDERIKNILGPVNYGLDEIKQLDPVSYALKSDPEQVPHLGFIAQQVNPIIPESVFDTDDHIEGEPEDAATKLGMEYVALIPVMVNAIKELSAEVDALKAQLQAS